MLKQIEAVIFDLDGTLIDSMWMWKAIDQEYLSRYGIPVPLKLQKEISGKSFTEVALYFQQKLKVPETIEAIKEEWNHMAMDKYKREVKAKPYAVQFLSELKRRGIKTGVATSNSRELADAAIEGCGLRPYLDEVHIACEVNHGKPFPDLFLLVAKSLAVKPEHCLVFEDLTEGILAAKAAGMRSCGVEDTFSSLYREEKKALADYYIESFEEVKEISRWS